MRKCPRHCMLLNRYWQLAHLMNELFWYKFCDAGIVEMCYDHYKQHKHILDKQMVNNVAVICFYEGWALKYLYNI